MMRKMVAAAAAVLGMLAGSVTPAQASVGWYNIVGGCTGDFAHYVKGSSQQRVYNSDTRQYFYELDVETVGGKYLYASIRKGDGSALTPEKVGSTAFHFSWGKNYPKSYDARVRVRFIGTNGTRCRVFYNPPQ